MTGVKIGNSVSSFTDGAGPMLGRLQEAWDVWRETSELWVGDDIGFGGPVPPQLPEGAELKQEHVLNCRRGVATVSDGDDDKISFFESWVLVNGHPVRIEREFETNTRAEIVADL